MAGDAEAGGGELLNVGEAGVELEDFSAGAAMEMMMVFLTGELIVSDLAGKFDGSEPAFVEQHLNVAIDGGDTEACVFAGGELEDLVGVERAVGGKEGGPDGATLTGVAGRAISTTDDMAATFLLRRAGNQARVTAPWLSQWPPWGWWRWPSTR